jgi:hypothetical protein
MSALSSRHETRSDASWASLGHQIGRELAEIDRNSGTRRRPDQLRIAPDTPAAYVDALRQSYAAAIAGAPLISEDF